MPQPGTVLSTLKVWKTVKLGTGLKIADDFRRALYAGGYQISMSANNAFRAPAFVVATKETRVNLVRVSVGGLGFPEGAYQRDIYRRALELGLYLCPPEIGPQLRLQYEDQLNGEWITVGMEPITESHAFYTFGVANDNQGLCLLAEEGRPDLFWYGPFLLVFVCRKRFFSLVRHRAVPG